LRRCSNCKGIITPKFHKGWLPIPDTEWKVETISKDGMSFVYIGIVKVSGKRVKKEMEDHQSIKGYEPCDIAKRMAHKKFPHINPIIVSQIWENEK